MKQKVLLQKLNIFLLIISLIFLTLIARLGYLQLVQSEKYQQMADLNRLRPVTIPAPRGKMFDQKGVALADNRMVYTISLAALELKEPEPIIKKLAELLEIKEVDIRKAIKAKTFRSYEPIVVAEDVPIEKVMRIQERRIELPGVVIDVTPKRVYPLQNVGSHVIGYIRQINEKQLKYVQGREPDRYRFGDKYGYEGLESYFESMLRGYDGYRWFEVDANHTPIRETEKKNPIPGNNLHLTLDSKLQRAAEEALKRVIEEKRKKFPEAIAGAVVLIEVDTGRVLAMASAPDFDPNILNGPITEEEVVDYLWKRPTLALSNRALYPYPPGSTIKMITTGAALRTGAVRPTEKIYDPGYVRLSADTLFKCWKPGGHGSVDAVKNLQVSCNIYTGLAAERAGSVEVAKLAGEFGFGKKTGINLTGEKEGLIPTPEWKKDFGTLIWTNYYNSMVQQIEDKYHKLIDEAKTDEVKLELEEEKQKELRKLDSQFKIDLRWNTTWQRYDTLYNSIGQGDTLTTPLQLANYVAAIANGGKLFKPYLVDKVTDASGKVVQSYRPEVVNKINMSEEHLEVLSKGMFAVTRPGGTAFGVFGSLPIPSAGKTGTSQVTNKDNHGLYVGYAPYDNPKVAVAAIVEHSGGGGDTGGAVARDLLKAYFGIAEPEPESTPQN